MLVCLLLKWQTKKAALRLLDSLRSICTGVQSAAQCACSCRGQRTTFERTSGFIVRDMDGLVGSTCVADLSLCHLAADKPTDVAAPAAQHCNTLRRRIAPPTKIASQQKMKGHSGA